LSNNAVLDGDAAVACSVAVANNASITGNLTYGEEIAVGPNGIVAGDISEFTCDVCDNARLTARCGKGLEPLSMRPTAEALLGATESMLDGVVPAGALMDGVLTLSNNQTATIPPGVYAFRAIYLENNASLAVSHSSAVLLVLEGLELRNNASLGTNGGRISVAVLQTGPVTFGNNTVARMSLYAPQVDLTVLANNVEFSGSIDVHNLTFNNNVVGTIDGLDTNWDSDVCE